MYICQHFATGQEKKRTHLYTPVIIPIFISLTPWPWPPFAFDSSTLRKRILGGLVETDDKLCDRALCSLYYSPVSCPCCPTCPLTWPDPSSLYFLLRPQILFDSQDTPNRQAARTPGPGPDPAMTHYCRLGLEAVLCSYFTVSCE